MFSLMRFPFPTLLLPALILVIEAMVIVQFAGLAPDLTRFFDFTRTTAPDFATPVLVSIPPHEFDYRPSGVHVIAGQEVDAAMDRRQLSTQLHIMRDQVSEAEYALCVQTGPCKPADSRWPAHNQPHPITGVSYDDAVKYAAWLSQQTSQNWRLPTDAEWVAAAGSRSYDDAIGTNSTPIDPAARWLDAYTQQNQAREAGGPPQPLGYFGANEFGLNDLSGNVWEWTDTCFTRTRSNTDAIILSVNETCAVHTVQGLHRTYISNFIRDAKNGGCSAGVPPSHLGFRLVHVPQVSPIEQILDWVMEALGVLLMKN